MTNADVSISRHAPGRFNSLTVGARADICWYIRWPVESPSPVDVVIAVTPDDCRAFVPASCCACRTAHFRIAGWRATFWKRIVLGSCIVHGVAPPGAWLGRWQCRSVSPTTRATAQSARKPVPAGRWRSRDLEIGVMPRQIRYQRTEMSCWFSCWLGAGADAVAIPRSVGYRAVVAGSCVARLVRTRLARPKWRRRFRLPQPIRRHACAGVDCSITLSRWCQHQMARFCW